MSVQLFPCGGIPSSSRDPKPSFDAIEYARFILFKFLCLQIDPEGSRDEDLLQKFQMLDLPKWIFENRLHESVTMLGLAHQELTVLPTEIRLLQNLTKLHLVGNRLQSLKGLEELHELRELNISNNQIEYLPKMSNFFKLEKLYAYNNQLTQLPSDLNQCRFLQVLQVESNQLKSLPSLTGLESLKSLTIRDNHFLILPDDIGNLPLETFIASKNSLTILPRSFGSLSKLWKLDLSDNCFTDFPEGIYSLPQLQIFDCSGNHISQIPRQRPPLLHELIAHNNQNFTFDCYPRTIEHIKG